MLRAVKGLKIGIHRGQPLEVDVGQRKLRHDVVGIVIHPSQDIFGNGLLAIAPFGRYPGESSESTPD